MAMHEIYALIGPDHGPITWWQMTLRGVLTFLYGLALVRLAGLRSLSRQTALDVMLAILIGSNLSRALTQGAPYFPTLAATAGITALYWASIHLAQRYDFVGRVLKGCAIVLARDGRADPSAMRSTGVSHLDLDEAIRRARLHGLDKVAQATLERSGEISVLPHKQ